MKPPQHAVGFQCPLDAINLLSYMYYYSSPNPPHPMHTLITFFTAATGVLAKLSLRHPHPCLTPPNPPPPIIFLSTWHFSLSVYPLHCKENHIYVFLFWELCSLCPNFHIYVSVSDLYIPRIYPHISCSRIGRSIVGIYISLTWMWKLGLWPRNSFSGNICFKFLEWFFPVYPNHLSTSTASIPTTSHINSCWSKVIVHHPFYSSWQSRTTAASYSPWRERRSLRMWRPMMGPGTSWLSPGRARAASGRSTGMASCRTGGLDWPAASPLSRAVSLSSARSRTTGGRTSVLQSHLGKPFFASNQSPKTYSIGDQSSFVIPHHKIFFVN